MGGVGALHVGRGLHPAWKAGLPVLHSRRGSLRRDNPGVQDGPDVAVGNTQAPAAGQE